MEKNIKYYPVLARRWHIYEIDNLISEIWGEGGRYSYEFYQNIILQDLSYIYMDKINNKPHIIAVCLCNYDEKNNKIGIDVLAVKKEFRGKGLGKSLLKFCLNKCKIYGPYYFELHVAVTNEIAINLYKKLGFETVGEIVKNYYNNDKPPDNDAYLMRKYINNDKNYDNYNINTININKFEFQNILSYIF